MRSWQVRRRVFKEALALPADDGGFAVTLDGRRLRTPGNRPLRLPTAALAQAVAAEWQAQAEVIDPQSMPLTQLVFTAIDRVAPQRDAVINELLKYAETDLVCYRAEGPADLVSAQHRCWQPLIDWLAAAWRAPLITVVGVLPAAQPAASLAALRSALASRDDLALTALASIVQAAGSLVIGLALADGRLDSEGACAAALLDEEYQAARWGRDEPAEQRRERIRAEIRAARRLMDLMALPAREGGDGGGG